MMNPHIQTIAAVVATLNKVKVEGEEDMNRMLASIQTLKAMKGEMENEADHQCRENV